VIAEAAAMPRRALWSKLSIWFCSPVICEPKPVAMLLS